jgi:hypothetical protein
MTAFDGSVRNQIADIAYIAAKNAIHTEYFSAVLPKRQNWSNADHALAFALFLRRRGEP